MKRGISRRQFSLGGIAGSAALTASRGRVLAQTAPLKIRVGWVVVPASLAPLILEKKDILKHFGQSYVAEATRSSCLAAMVASVIAKSVPPTQ